MRLSIRNQLATLVLLSSLVCLAIISIATWYANHTRLQDARAGKFELIASLKAAQLASNLALMERSVGALSSRARLQSALQGYLQGNNTAQNWSPVLVDFQSALAGQRSELLTLQAIVYPSISLAQGDANGILNVTAMAVNGSIELPYVGPDGPVTLGESGLGYPPDLYPNLTYTSPANTAQLFGNTLNPDSAVLLGPLSVNQSFVLLSITVPIINNTSATDILGYLTVVLDGSLLIDVVSSSIGLAHSGVTLLLGPNTLDNQLSNASRPAHALARRKTPKPPDIEIRYILPPNETYSDKRHAQHAYGKPQTFNGSSYPLVDRGLTVELGTINNAGGTLSTRNEEGISVGIGYASPQTTLCDWLLAVEYSHTEAWFPIQQIKNTLLACVFATAFGAALWTIPIAHFSSAPIRRLRDATANAVDPGEDASAEPSGSAPGQSSGEDTRADYNKDGAALVVHEKTNGDGSSPPESLSQTYGNPRDRVHEDLENGSFGRKRFKIPQRVKDGHHWIEDDLTDLTRTFNEMSDELTMHYGRLEERVRQRTAELELAKKAAESANESKTLFIANISHELKTPLNGILGMCAVAMSEDDPTKIKRSLNIIYKSGDLLHHLLTDLLTFSKHQVGKNLSLDEKEFRLRDIGVQLHAIFTPQALEGQIDFTVEYQGPKDSFGNRCSYEDGNYGPDGTGKVKDFVLWGDSQRILQVAINLVSNSLKFTPKGGTVKLRIRCMDELNGGDSMSRQPSLAPSEKRRWGKEPPRDTRLSQTASRAASVTSKNSETPPDQSAPRLVFEFEVEDTGPGIPPHLQKQIFEPFVQGDLRLTKKYGGTGLGLSICSQLSTLMHGTLHLKSEVGQGSTFTLRIPLRLCRMRADSAATSIIDAPLSGHASGPSSPSVRLSRRSSDERERESSPNKPIDLELKPRLVGLSAPYFSTGQPPMASPGSDLNGEQLKKEGRLKVLVAEDNVTNAEVVTRMLKLEEVFDVALAKDGQEALEKVKESMAKGLQYDMIFMDVQMPNLDGRESTRLIREMGYSAPIVALTAFSDEINQRECMDSGMDFFLSKPIKRPALKQVLKTYCPPIQEEPEQTKVTEVNPFANTSVGNDLATKDSLGPATPGSPLS